MRAALALVALVALVALAAVGCGGGEEARLLPPERALATTRSISPSLHLFGDPIVARVQLVVDRRLLDPDQLRVRTDFEPYERIGTVRRTRREDGPYTRLRYEQALRCLTIKCIPDLLASAAGAREPGRGERRTFIFRPARILYDEPGRASPELLRFVLWPPLVSVSRINEVQAGAKFPFRGSPTPLAALTQRVSPPLLAGTLLLVALALLVVPVRLGFRWQARRRPAPVEEPAVGFSTLEQALQLVEWSCGRTDGAERREALERLAGALAETGSSELVDRSRELAWSRASPSAEAATALVELVRGDDGASA